MVDNLCSQTPASYHVDMNVHVILEAVFFHSREWFDVMAALVIIISVILLLYYYPLIILSYCWTVCERYLEIINGSVRSIRYSTKRAIVIVFFPVIWFQIQPMI